MDSRASEFFFLCRPALPLLTGIRSSSCSPDLGSSRFRTSLRLARIRSRGGGGRGYSSNRIGIGFAASVFVSQEADMTRYFTTLLAALALAGCVTTDISSVVSPGMDRGEAIKRAGRPTLEGPDFVDYSRQPWGYYRVTF